MNKFVLKSEYKPTGDQPQASEKLVQNRPTLVIAHNKTLAAQLYNEFKEFFPTNSVQFFIS